MHLTENTPNLAHTHATETQRYHWHFFAHSSHSDVRCFWFSISISLPLLTDTLFCGFYCCWKQQATNNLCTVISSFHFVERVIYNLNNSLFAEPKLCDLCFRRFAFFSVNIFSWNFRLACVVLRCSFSLQKLKLLFITVIFAFFLRIYGMHDEIGGDFFHIDLCGEKLCGRTKIRKKFN